MQGFKELAPYILSQNSTGIRSIRQKSEHTHTHVHTGWGEEKRQRPKVRQTWCGIWGSIALTTHF